MVIQLLLVRLNLKVLLLILLTVKPNNKIVNKGGIYLTLFCLFRYLYMNNITLNGEF